MDLQHCVLLMNNLKKLFQTFQEVQEGFSESTAISDCLNVKILNSQLDKLNSAIKNTTGKILR